MTNDSWNLVVLWRIEIGEFELIDRYSKFETAYYQGVNSGFQDFKISKDFPYVISFFSKYFNRRQMTSKTSKI